MARHIATIENRGFTFTATLVENNGCHETVHLNTPEGGMLLHESRFDARNLGASSRDEYTRALCHSVINNWLSKR